MFATWCNYGGEEHRDKEVYYAKSKVWCDVKQSALVGRRKPCTASPCVCQSTGCWAPGWHLACRMFSLAVEKLSVCWFLSQKTFKNMDFLFTLPHHLHFPCKGRVPHCFICFTVNRILIYTHPVTLNAAVSVKSKARMVSAQISSEKVATFLSVVQAAVPPVVK